MVRENGGLETGTTTHSMRGLFSDGLQDKNKSAWGLQMRSRFRKNGIENGASKFTERVQKTMAQANIHTVDLRLLEAQAKTRG